MITETDAVRIIAGMGYKAGFAHLHKYSYLAKTPVSISLYVWHGSPRKQSYIGKMKAIAQLSEVELRKRIEDKVKNVEGKIDRSRH